MAKKGQVSLYALQKAAKPTIEEICDILLTRPELREGMTSLITLSKELKMKPCWSHTNNWNCNYKGKRVVSYLVGMGDKQKQDWLKIKLHTAEKGDIDNFLQALPSETAIECIDGMKCYGCGDCKPGRQYMILGKKQYLCKRLCYQRINPTPKQFQLVATLIPARREYIKL